MTEKLYERDPYATAFTATVLGAEEGKDGWRIRLDATAFFPCEGGQGADRGTLGTANVLDVRLEGGELYHITDAPLAVGETVEGVLDAERRLRHMRTHTAEHILSGVLFSLYGTKNVGFHLGESEVTLDLDLPLTEAEVAAAEEAANRAILENRAVRILWPTPDELATLTYRAKLDLAEGVRLVEIDGVDLCACCAPHVARTGECGLLKVTGYMHYKGGVRLHIAVGLDALDDYRQKQETVHNASVALSLPEERVTEGLARLFDTIAEGKRAMAELRAALRRERISSLLATGGRALVLEDITPADLRPYAEEAAERAGGRVLVLLPEEGGVRYAVASPVEDVRPLGNALHTALGGRGGGKPPLVQGSIPADAAAVLAVWEGL